MIFRECGRFLDGEWSYAAGGSGAIVPLPLDEKREYHTIAGLLMGICSVFQNLAKKFRWGIICLNVAGRKPSRAEGADYTAA